MSLILHITVTLGAHTSCLSRSVLDLAPSGTHHLGRWKATTHGDWCRGTSIDYKTQDIQWQGLGQEVWGLERPQMEWTLGELWFGQGSGTGCTTGGTLEALEHRWYSCYAGRLTATQWGLQRHVQARLDLINVTSDKLKSELKSYLSRKFK